jgi:hypothetical protein
MRTIFLQFLAGASLLLIALPAQAQTSLRAQAVMARDTFDPATHALGRRIDGRIELLASEYVLGKALRRAFPELGAMEKMEKRQANGQDYLVFTLLPKTGEPGRYFVGIVLQTDPDGYVFASPQAIFCDGRQTGCNDCQAVEGCPCNGGGTACQGGPVSRMALAPVSTIPD